MMKLSAFVDEIDRDLPAQMQGLEEQGIAHAELRSVWGTNALDLSEEQLAHVKRELDAHGIRVSCLGSPIGKIKITDSFEPHLVRFQRALDTARVFETQFIRIFSFFVPEGVTHADCREETLRRMKTLTEWAEKAGVVLLHENEKHIYGDTAERCAEILKYCNSPHLRAAFDPANFVQCGERPVTESYAALKDYIDYVHIKDAMLDSGRVVPPGEGDGEVPELIALLRDRGYDGFLSIEHHLRRAGRFEGYSGADLFRTAAHALKGILRTANVAWH